jgi:hypothetical protein
MAMCMPAAGGADSGLQLSAQFAAFAVLSAVPGPRGAEQLATPNYLMLVAALPAGQRQLLSLEFMGTTELWTFPRSGYPELLQVGEQRADGQPYRDAQHPHSSPVMGLLLADTLELGASRTLELSFAPRGASSDGPVAFMHRESARDNPDAPLGHHVGQDVGHISSTVLAAQLALGRLTLEASAFNGSEPEPTHVDLPLGRIDSGALRLTLEFVTAHRLAASLARVRQADPEYPGSSHATRGSVSLTDRFGAVAGPHLDHALIFGVITRDGPTPTLHSLLDEGTLNRGHVDFWWRVETLERLASELGVVAAATGNERRWVQALTLGATRWHASASAWQLGLGASLTLDHVPGDWAMAYGGHAPLSARLILQLRGNSHWRR